MQRSYKDIPLLSKRSFTLMNIWVKSLKEYTGEHFVIKISKNVKK